jgi:hypothetical protein
MGIGREIIREANRRNRNSYAGYVAEQKRREQRAAYKARYEREQAAKEQRERVQAAQRAARRAARPKTETTPGAAAILALVASVAGGFLTWGAVAAYGSLTGPLGRSCNSSFCSGPPSTPGDYFLTSRRSASGSRRSS